MGNKLIFSIFLLLFVIVLAHGNASGETEDAAAVIANGANILRFPGLDVFHQTEDNVKHSHGHVQDHDHDHGHAGHMHMGSPETSMFFFLSELKVGNVMPIYFRKIDPSKSFNFLPKQQADSIPFSSEALPYLLHLFSISPDSPQAKAMADTFSICEAKPIQGEVQTCSTSLESLFDFGHSVFGSESGIQILTTSQTSKSSPLLQNYTILEWKEMTTPKMIGCHNQAYPYTVYYCHSQKSGTRVFKVLLEGENGDRVDAVPVCHMDTSHWNPNHVSFGLLGIKPGMSEVCHFFPADDLVLVPGPAPTL